MTAGPEPPRPRIALVAPFRGARAAWGRLLADSTRALAGYPVEWSFLDDDGDAERSARRAAQITADGGFAAVIGHFNSGGAARALPVYGTDTAVLLPLATAPGLLRGQPHAALRLCPADDGQVAAIVGACRSAGTTLSVLDDGSDYGRRIAGLLRAEAGDLAVGSDRAAGAVAVCGVHHAVAEIVRGLDGRPTVYVTDDCDIDEFAAMSGAAAPRIRVAGLVGGPPARVAAACAAAAGALTKHPAERGIALVRRIRGELAYRFDDDGELVPNAGGEWEVRPLRRPAARTGRGAPFDAAVVGAGLVGRIAAADLAEAGARVALIDPAEPAESASVASGALVRAFEPEAERRTLALRAFQRVWQRPDAAAHGFHRTGSLVLLDDATLAVAGSAVAEMNAAGVPAFLIDAADVRRRWPGLRTDRAAVWEPGGGYVISPVVLASQLDRAHRNGVTHLAGHRVDTIAPAGAGASDLACTGPAGATTVRAHTVLIAAGCGSPALAGDRWPADRAAATKRIRYAVFERGTIDLPTLVDLAGGVWGRPDGSGGYLAGCPIDDWPAAPGSGADIGADHLATIRAAASALIPALGDAAVLRCHHGTDLFAAAPVLESRPGPSRLVIAAGWSGGGFKTAPAAGARAAEIVMGLRPTRTAG